jgi:hypothetical protein
MVVLEDFANGLALLIESAGFPSLEATRFSSEPELSDTLIMLRGRIGSTPVRFVRST